MKGSNNHTIALKPHPDDMARILEAMPKEMLITHVVTGQGQTVEVQPVGLEMLYSDGYVLLGTSVEYKLKPVPVEPDQTTTT